MKAAVLRLLIFQGFYDTSKIGENRTIVTETLQSLKPFSWTHVTRPKQNNGHTAIWLKIETMQQDTKPGTFTDQVEILSGDLELTLSQPQSWKVIADNLNREGEFSNVEPCETYFSPTTLHYPMIPVITKYSWRGKSENTSLLFSFFLKSDSWCKIRKCMRKEKEEEVTKISLLNIWLSCNLRWWKAIYFVIAEE